MYGHPKDSSGSTPSESSGSTSSESSGSSDETDIPTPSEGSSSSIGSGETDIPTPTSSGGSSETQIPTPSGIYCVKEHGTQQELWYTLTEVVAFPVVYSAENCPADKTGAVTWIDKGNGYAYYQMELNGNIHNSYDFLDAEVPNLDEVEWLQTFHSMSSGECPCYETYIPTPEE